MKAVIITKGIGGVIKKISCKMNKEYENRKNI